ncbi:TRAP transporter substrate-binding protein DctP [Aminobacter sp. MSH1]|uniref:TRAP transporter substrate-binding protein DctP n=1 Tax=Aminobacter sp. MSH1 TaxID=374606 RepID=UPI001FE23D02|nr:TRAP transporter substrate-binding protein DctP [Aminobacter sp. MSH1]
MPLSLGTSVHLASAEDKPLIRRWLDGEVKAKFPEITYAGEPITLRYSTFIQEFPIDVQAFKLLETATNGKLVVKPYWGNSLADAQKGAFDAVSGGIADFGNCYVGFNPGGFTVHPLLATPFLFKDSATASLAGLELYPEFLKKEYEAKGVYLIRMNLTRPSQILTARKAIKSLEDAKGQKMHLVGSPYIKAIQESLGMVPVFVANPEVYTAFQSGVVDGIPSHDAAYALFKWLDYGKYHTDADLWPASFEYCLNKDKFDGLPADLKQTFYHWAQLLNQAYAQLYFDAFSEKARADMKATGIEFIELTVDEKKRWSDAAQPAVDQAVEATKANGSAEFVAALRKKAAEYDGMKPDDITAKVLEAPITGLINF